MERSSLSLSTCCLCLSLLFGCHYYRDDHVPDAKPQAVIPLSLPLSLSLLTLPEAAEAAPVA